MVTTSQFKGFLHDMLNEWSETADPELQLAFHSSLLAPTRNFLGDVA